MYSFQMWLAFLSHMIIKQSTNTYFVLFRTHFLLMLLTLNCFPAFLLRNCDISNLGCNHNTQRPWPRSAWVSSWCRWKRSLYINGRSHWPWLASTADYSHGNYQRVVSFFQTKRSVCLSHRHSCEIGLWACFLEERMPWSMHNALYNCQLVDKFN